MSRRGLAALPSLVFVGLLIGCSSVSDPEEALGVAAQPIVEGTTTTGDPGVVPLLSGGRVYCTGTLVNALTVVTAAHCLQEARPDAIELPGGSTVRVATTLPYPEFDPISLANDIAVLVLEREVDPTLARPLMSGRLETFVGASLRLVGYGKATPDDRTPKKRTGDARIASLEATRLAVEPAPAGPCGGDSGGPAFLSLRDREVLVGVVSSGDPTCEGISNFTRIDAFLPWLVRQVASAEPHTQRTGGPCLGPRSCAEGSCLSPSDAPSRPYCTKPCTNDEACPSPMVCEDARCVHRGPSPGAIGARCSTDEECETARCGANGAEPAVCAKLCVEDITTCTAGSCVRDARHPGQSACLREPDVTAAAQGCTTGRPPPRGSSSILAASAFVVLALVRRLRRRVRSRAGS